MSLAQLYNEKQILGACRSYRRACRRLQKLIDLAQQQGFALDEIDALLAESREEVRAIRDRLLYFAETGSRSYPHVGKR